MNQSTQRAIQHLFQASSLEAVSREQLETFVEEYPCFGFGHYLLSRKLQAENSEQFLTATQKTSLYFPNPFWLQWMLENGADSPAKDILQYTVREDHPVRIDQAALEDHSSEVDHPVARDPVHVDQPVHGEHVNIEQTIPEVQPVPSEQTIRDEEPAFIVDEPGHWPEMESPAVPAETMMLHPDTGNAPIRDDEPPFVLDETDRSPESPAQAIVEAPVPETAAPAIDAVAASANESAPLFEPLHTIDYFASQGIRLTLEENPTDPLGRQLKSFTEWLRTMRRLPQKDREIIPDRAAEQTIQNFAAHSIEGKEPITETMAEVLAKQGMPERARIVYEKLSLLEPDKSAYFAAKIEQLNIP